MYETPIIPSKNVYERCLGYTKSMIMPDDPKIFHILHVDHLTSIINDGGLFSDAIMSNREDYGTNIGMDHIKAKRLVKAVGDSSHGMVGEHVPFYFRPRSMMLFVISQRKHPNITYRDGQRNVIHLVSHVNAAIKWAADNGKSWAFSDRNASAGYAQFFYRTQDLKELHWDVMDSKYFSNDSVTRDAVQAEFLVKDTFAWELIDEVVVHNDEVKAKVEEMLAATKHKPVVRVEKRWYY